MELKIEHLAPYLPYRLKILVDTSYSNWESNSICEIKSIDLTRNIIEISFDNLEINSSFYKPILRPMCDLSELRLQKDVSYITELWYDVISTDDDFFDKDTFYENCELGNIDLLPIKVFNKLLEYHFDVLGLIEKGLAVDVNTI